MKTVNFLHKGLALGLCLFFNVTNSHAATIIVDASDGAVLDNNQCSISEAIINANDGDQTHDDCVAGDVGSNIIELNADAELLVAYEVDSGLGSTGTPAINSVLVLDGKGHALQRDENLDCDIDNPAATDFRLVRVTEQGQLSLRDITLENGCATDYQPSSLTFEFEEEILGFSYTVQGGAIFSQGCLDIEGVVMRANQAEIGGAIASFNEGGFGKAQAKLNRGETLSGIQAIINSVFINNSASYTGGAIYANNNQMGSIRNSQFRDNSAYEGGAISAGYSQLEQIDSVTFSGNTAEGAGGALYFSDSGVSEIVNSTFSAQTAEKGSAIMAYYSSIDELTNSTFSSNTSTDGGTIKIDETAIFDLNNSLFHNNNTNNHPECQDANMLRGTAGFSGNNNMTDHTGSGCPGLLLTSLTTSSVLDLADNGCNTMLPNESCVLTHALTETSEAIDLGTVDSTTQDQRGFPAIGARDLGAFELVTTEALCLKSGIDVTQVFQKTVNDLPELIQAIECANHNTDSHDTIRLNADVTMNSALIDNENGASGLPTITSVMTMDGQNHLLERDGLGCNLNGSNEAGEFRLFHVANSGHLQLRHIELKGGCADGDPGAPSEGGAILSQGHISVDSVPVVHFNLA